MRETSTNNNSKNRQKNLLTYLLITVNDLFFDVSAHIYALPLNCSESSVNVSWSKSFMNLLRNEWWCGTNAVMLIIW